MMARAKGYESMVIALRGLEHIEMQGVLDLRQLFKLRHNAKIYQRIVTLTLSTTSDATELDEQLAVARKMVNGIMPLLNKAVIYQCLPIGRKLAKGRCLHVQQQYRSVREQMSYLISLVDPVLADDFDVAHA